MRNASLLLVCATVFAESPAWNSLMSEAQQLQKRGVQVASQPLATAEARLAGSLTDYATLSEGPAARSSLGRNPGERLARLTIDVRELEPPESFLPAR